MRLERESELDGVRVLELGDRHSDERTESVPEPPPEVAAIVGVLDNTGGDKGVGSD